MQTVLIPSKPDAIEFTLSITMTLGEWKELREEVDSKKHTGWKLRAEISDMIQMAQTKFYPRTEQ